ncbi:MAG: SGNH/GDSL hydrolase family protein [bacterium]
MIKRSVKAYLTVLIFGSFMVHNAIAQSVLIVGDSWAEQQWTDQVHTAVFNNHGLNPNVYGANTVESGTTAAQWNTPARLQLITTELQNFPDIKIVQLTLGGNDFLDLWRVNMTVAEETALQQQIKSDLDGVIQHILAQRSDLEVIMSFYDYPNFEDTLTGPSGFFCEPLWSSMAQPSTEELNNAAVDFVKQYAQLATSNPRVFYVAHFGLMQNSYGFPDLGIAPGDIGLPGDLTKPSPMDAMRFGLDCFHLSPEGYQILVENLYQNYFSNRFDRIFSTGFEQ